MYQINTLKPKRVEYGLIFDDFLKYPDKVAEMLFTLNPIAHKKGCEARELPSYNGKLFKDMRHTLYSNKVEAIYKLLGRWSKQNPLGDPSDGNLGKRITTNVFRIKDDPFHTPDTHYWWPHYDMGWTAILYLNEIDDTGTNLYRSLDKGEEEAKDITEEHYEPWRSKDKYELLYTFEPKFNRLVFFNAKDICHGQNIHSESELFRTNKCRMNQVFFFDGYSKNSPIHH